MTSKISLALVLAGVVSSSCSKSEQSAPKAEPSNEPAAQVERATRGTQGIAAAVAGIADTPVAQGMLRGMGAVSAGLIAAVGIKLMGALKNNPMGMLTCICIGALTFIAIGLLRLPLAWVLLSLGPLASVWAAHCIKQRGTA